MTFFPVKHLLSPHKTVNMNVPQNLKYTKDHEWVSIDGNIATVGITDFAQRELGDIVYVDISVTGETIAREDVFGTVEAVKTVSDLFMPLTGKIIELNAALDKTPEVINNDAYGNGWMIRIEIADLGELSNLLSAEEYGSMINA